MFIAVEAMRRVLTTASGHQVAWIARDGVEAVERCANDRPDLILMDLIMPRLDGVEATRQIMARTPCAIVVVTANVNDNASKVFEAMGAGALDAVNTPVLESPGAGNGAAALLAKIETIRRLLGGDRRQGTGDRRKQTGNSRAPISHLPSAISHLPSPLCPLVAIGASAGGPAALAKVLGQLPAEFPAPVIVVQHVDGQFAQGLASWLDEQTPLRVRLAEEGDRPEAGAVLLAGRDNHLV